MLSIIKFIVCASMIFLAGRRVARYGDIIAEKTGLGGLWIGLVLVAITTSLPEIFTGVGSVLFVDAPDLTVGNIFGANTYNLLNLATLDFLYKEGVLLSTVSLGQLLSAAFSILLLVLAVAGIFFTQRLGSVSVLNISLFSVLIFLCYLVLTRLIFKFEQDQQRIAKELRKEAEELMKYNEVNTPKAFLLFGIWAAVIVAAGVWLAYIGDELAAVWALERSFVGSLLLSFATTLPELTVSVAALRLGAKEMAVANLVGSNLFNVTIIFLNDLLYRKSDIFLKLSGQHIFTSLIIIAMTTVVIAAQIIKPKKKMFFRLSAPSLWLIVIFVLGGYVNFLLSR